jgi:hypothetical protein
VACMTPWLIETRPNVRVRIVTNDETRYPFRFRTSRAELQGVGSLCPHFQSDRWSVTLEERW